MSDLRWVRHPDTGAVVEVPASAVPPLASSGWQQLTTAEIAEQEKRLAAERAARVASLTPADPAESADEDKATEKPAAARRSTTEKGSE